VAHEAAETVIILFGCFLGCPSLGCVGRSFSSRSLFLGIACSGWRSSAMILLLLLSHGSFDQQPGTQRAVSIRNIGGSFYHFETRLMRGTASEALAGPPDEWGGRAAVAWARRLAGDSGFDAAAEDLVLVSDVLDRIYAAGVAGSSA
jgi:hypothetical protein